MRHLRMRVISALVVSLLAAWPVGVVAQDEAPMSGGPLGRIEVPEAGCVISFPDDWTTMRPTAADLESMGVDLGSAELVASLHADGAALFDLALLAFAPTSPSGAVAEVCTVVSLAHGGLSAESILSASLGGMDDGADVTMLELPSGDVAQVDFALHDPLGDAEISAWLFVDPQVVHVLVCAGLERPDDSWVSIAETFEFLPSVTTEPLTVPLEPGEAAYRWLEIERSQIVSAWDVVVTPTGDAVAVAGHCFFDMDNCYLYSQDWRTWAHKGAAQLAALGGRRRRRPAAGSRRDGRWTLRAR